MYSCSGGDKLRNAGINTGKQICDPSQLHLRQGKCDGEDETQGKAGKTELWTHLDKSGQRKSKID